MDVMFKGKVYRDFERKPNIRSEWGEDLVKRYYESLGFLAFRTKDIDQVGLDTSVREFIDILFKNKEVHSTDVICFLETEERKRQRLKDEVFVRSIIAQRRSYNLGKFLKGKYHLDIIGNRRGITKICLYPHILFIEVKTCLTTSKPPFISPAELYRLLYWREKIGEGACFLAIIEINLAVKKATMNFVFPTKFHNLDLKWHKITEKRGFATLTDESGFTKIKLPILIPRKGKTHIPLLTINQKDNEVRFDAHNISYEVQIETI